MRRIERERSSFGGGGGGGGSAYKRAGGALRLVNFGFWSHLRCSGQNAIIFSCEDLV